MGLKAGESTIDTNKNGGDAGVLEKRQAAMKLLEKIHQTGMPADVGAARYDVPGGKSKQGGKSGGKTGKPSAQRDVPGGHKKQ